VGKLFHLEPKFARFLYAVKRIYVGTHFLEALKNALTCLQFLRKFLSKKGESEGGYVIPIREVCSSLCNHLLSCRIRVVSLSPVLWEICRLKVLYATWEPV